MEKVDESSLLGEKRASSDEDIDELNDNFDRTLVDEDLATISASNNASLLTNSGNDEKNMLDDIPDGVTVVTKSELMTNFGITSDDLLHASTLDGAGLIEFMKQKFPHLLKKEESRIEFGLVLHLNKKMPQNQAAVLAGCSPYQIARAKARLAERGKSDGNQKYVPRSKAGRRPLFKKPQVTSLKDEVHRMSLRLESPTLAEFYGQTRRSNEGNADPVPIFHIRQPPKAKYCNECNAVLGDRWVKCQDINNCRWAGCPENETCLEHRTHDAHTPKASKKKPRKTPTTKTQVSIAENTRLEEEDDDEL